MIILLFLIGIKLNMPLFYWVIWAIALGCRVIHDVS